ncbi:tripartite tricarboxylate transporter substrate binding protein [Acidovorax sp. 1608163]|uniref:Bug family tripartite tricarboxylate transporter substrate binding protein n=1 Tax=Acidovorax sp. 1608163 TaxID=2478662 RepID=UPI000EF6A968|nr:tripartite tricarboxylate transporter substrate binding protein [Acidovorax sp. 1608163]AYM94963.1 tripartite tricarboxylate transporter substrate binding protein [Acidovorax sp. 1608163]
MYPQADHPLATRRSALVGGLALAAALACATTAHAQGAAADAAWPTKPVRLISPYPVGGGPDGVARLLADKLSRKWGKPVVVENRPGGNGFIAIDAFKRGAKDGHDLIQLDSVHLAAYPYMFKKLPYDAGKDFDVLATMFKSYMFFVVPTNSKYKTVADIVADAKANPGKLDYGSWSIGNPVHLGIEELQQRTGTKMEHVLFKETTQLYVAVANGELPFTLGTAGTAGPLYRAGKVRFVAVAAPYRLSAYPNVPTVAEAGGPAAPYEVSGWNAIAGPKGVPPAVAEKVRADIAEALSTPDVKEKFDSFGYEPLTLDRAKLQAYIQSESARHETIIQRAKIEMD